MQNEPVVTLKEETTLKSEMALQSAVPAPPLETFNKPICMEDDMSDDGFHLRLSDVEDELDRNIRETALLDLENEDEILNKFDVDEKETNKTDAEVAATPESSSSPPKELISDSMEIREEKMNVEPLEFSSSPPEKSSPDSSEIKGEKMNADIQQSSSPPPEKLSPDPVEKEEEKMDVEPSEETGVSNCETASNEKLIKDQTEDIKNTVVENAKNETPTAQKPVDEVKKESQKELVEESQEQSEKLQEAEDLKEKHKEGDLVDKSQEQSDKPQETEEIKEKDDVIEESTSDKETKPEDLVEDKKEATQVQTTESIDKDLKKDEEKSPQTTENLTETDTAKETEDTEKKLPTNGANVLEEGVEKETPASDANILKEGMDTEDLLQVTTVKEVAEDFVNREEIEKDETSNENSSCSASEKDETEMADDANVETIIDESLDKEIDGVEMEEPTDKMDTKEEAECTDAMDIEESNPLTDDVNDEVDKEYKNLTKEDMDQSSNHDESSKEGKSTESEVTPNGDILKDTGKPVTVNDSDISKNDSDMVKEKPDVLKTDSDSVECVEIEDATEGVTGSTSTDAATPKCPKRPLLNATSDGQPKKIKLADSESPARKLKLLGGLSEYMRSKGLKRLSRSCLEEFCLQKVCEVLIHRSELADLRDQLQKQDVLLEKWRKEYRELSKQTKDLEIVHKKLMNELKSKQPHESVEPVKITRSVGLQVKLVEISSGTTPIKRKSVTRVSDMSPQTPNLPPGLINKTPQKTPPTPVRQQPRQVAPKPSTTILSQALQKDSPANKANNAAKPSPVKTVPTPSSAPIEQKGIIDLTDEDDKKTSTPASPMVKGTTRIVPVKTQTAIRSTTPVTQGILLTASPQLKPSMPGAQANGQRFYLLNSQVPQNVLTAATDSSKPGGQKTLMLKLPTNTIIGQPNGIIPTLQNGTSTISLVPQVATIRTTPVRLQPVQTTASKNSAQKAPLRHPAPLPNPPPPPAGISSRRPVPPKPQLSIRKSGQGIVLSWKMPYNLDMFEVIASYQLYAYQETSSPPSSDMWRKVGDVKALALPMACTLTQFADGNKYYFAVRAVDIHKRIGPFSDPEQIML